MDNRNRVLEEHQEVWNQTFNEDVWVPADGPWSGGAMTQSYTVSGVQLDLFDQDKELRAKYPALKDAYDHYNNIKKLCLSKEKEDHAD
jgi:hypothetical protein